MKAVTQLLNTFLYFFALLYLIRPETGLIDGTGALRVEEADLAFVTVTGLIAAVLVWLVSKRHFTIAKV